MIENEGRDARWVATCKAGAHTAVVEATEMKTAILCTLLTLAPAVVGCGHGMAMGQGQMTAKDADDAKELNAPLAVGGSIQPDVQMELQGTAAPTLVLVSAQPSVVAAEQGRLIGRGPGVSAILVTTKAGQVLDFYHLWVEQPTRATLHRLYPDGRDMGEVREGIDLMVGESAVLSPRLYYQAQELSGVVDGQWLVQPPLASVLRDGVGERRRVVATQPRRATLSVAVAGVSLKVPLRVVKAPTASVAPPASPALAVPAGDEQ